MARQIVILALVLFSVVGFASAAAATTNAVSPSASPSKEDSSSSSGIGTVDGSDDDAAPVGGPVPDGVFPPTASTDAPALSPKSAGTALEVSSAVAGVSAAVIASAFF